VLEYLPDYDVEGMIVFSRFDNRAAQHIHLGSIEAEEMRLVMALEIQNNVLIFHMKGPDEQLESVRTSRWVSSGIGFIGR
jgi:hypothetical protein